MKKRSFTMIELLSVIAVIGILIGILLPAMNKVQEKGKKTQARADISALKMAISQYQQTFGQLPAPATPTGTDTLKTSTDLKSVLSGTNPRNAIFLELHSDGEFNDPWDAAYQIVMDTDYNGQVSVLSTTVYGAAAIWSTGGGNEDITSWEQ